MINQNKINCGEYADLRLGKEWRKENKNNLFRNYIKNEDIKEIRDAYFCAILYRYWNLIDLYYRKSSSSASLEDVYEWLISAAEYTLEKRMWENPKSSIYNDPNGPDKVMNRMIKSFRLGHYEKTNTLKRKANITAISLDQIQEEDFNNDGLNHVNLTKLIPFKNDEGISKLEDPTTDIIIKSFNKRDFFTSFMVFNIIHQDVFNIDLKSNKIKDLNLKKLNHHMRNIDENICNIFATSYHIDKKEVEEAAKVCNSLSNTRVYSAIKRSLNMLSTSKVLLGE